MISPRTIASLRHRTPRDPRDPQARNFQSESERLLTPGANAYDMMYGAELSLFLSWAQRHRAGAVADGLGMLVEQAAEAFFIWRGIRPGTRPVIARVRRELVAQRPRKGG